MKRAAALCSLTAALVITAAVVSAAIIDREGEKPSGPSADAGAAQRSGFRYESAPLNRGPLPVRLVSFASRGATATGLLTIPPGTRAKMPAVVYLHGLGADSGDFTTESVFMAANGVVTLSLDSADPDPGELPQAGIDGLRADLGARRATQRRILSAIGLLKAHPRVDRDRIALVGFSRGGAVAALAARRAPSLAAEVYVSAGAGLDTWPGRVGELAPGDRREAARLVAAIDPARSAAANPHDRPRLVQFGNRDRIIPLASLRRFARAVPRPKRVRRFEAGHPLSVRALYERIEWLKDILPVDGPPVRGGPQLTPRRN